MTDSSEGCIIVHEILVYRLVCPIDGIYRVRLVVTVLDTLLVTVEFLSVEDERNSLRCIHRSLGKLDHLQTVFLRCLGSLFQTVTETVVIVAAHIAHMLQRIVCPALHTYLRMLHSSGYSELKICLVPGNSVHETGILASERATYRITDIVTECSYPVEHMCIDLEGYLLCRICRRHGSPAFAIYNHIRVDGMKTFAYFIHDIHVMNGHKVETESVDMIFLHPPFEGFDHILAEHLLLGSGLIAAT